MTRLQIVFMPNACPSNNASNQVPITNPAPPPDRHLSPSEEADIQTLKFTGNFKALDTQYIPLREGMFSQGGRKKGTTRIGATLLPYIALVIPESLGHGILETGCPMENVILSSDLSYKIIRLSLETGFLSLRQLSQFWPANFTTMGGPLHTLEPIGKPAVVKNEEGEFLTPAYNG